jgi:hypothetical protein
MMSSVKGCDDALAQPDPGVGAEADEQLICDGCGWRLPWAAYHQTYRGKQLFGANAVEHVAAYHRAFPQARGAAAQMRQIDGLIHAFHVSLREVGRPAAANLIAGSLRDVILLLDGLAGGEASAADLGDARTPWRQTLAAIHWAQPFLPPRAITEQGGTHAVPDRASDDVV